MNNRKWNALHWDAIIESNVITEKMAKDFERNDKNEIVNKETRQIVVPSNKRETIIKQIYDEFGLSSGLKKLYDQISRRYLNIKRSDVKDFLDKQIEYQLTKKPIRKSNKKMLTTNINKIFSIDLIDMNPLVSKNKQYRYILTVVDNFSRYVFLSKLKIKDGRQVVNALKEICLLKSHPPQTYPSAILSDNGLEFKNQFMTEFCRENNIKQIFGLPHNPRSNSLAETTNKVIRDTLKRMFVKNGNLNWSDHLDEVSKAINDTRVNSTGISRSDAYIENKGKENIKESMMTKGKTQQNNIDYLQLGDKVRISLSSLNSNLRKKVKEGNSKYIIVTYSFEIYQISRVYKSKNPLLKIPTK
jgi:transposase InsO family protein